MNDIQRDTIQAMESVLAKIGDYLGVEPGDVDGLLAEIERLTTENERWKKTAYEIADWYAKSGSPLSILEIIAGAQQNDE